MNQLVECKELSWVELKNEYKESRKKIVNYIDKEKEDNSKYKKVNLEVSRSINRDLEDRIKDLEAKCLYEFNSVSEDLTAKAILTDRQREVMQLRQKHSVKEISDKLEITSQGVFNIYKQALTKIDKYLKNKDKDEQLINLLSPQQRKIYFMMKNEKIDCEIVNELGLTRQSFNKQKSRINEKLKLVKTKLVDKH